MKFCPVVPEICRGQVHGPRKERRKRNMNLTTADLRNYWTEFHETLWSYRYMFFFQNGCQKMGGKNSTLPDIIKI
jgi:hypothetical protein